LKISKFKQEILVRYFH